MPLSRLCGAALVAGAAALATLALAQPAFAQKKEPPACAAVSFRPIAPGAPDGETDAGLYKSRFGKIEVKAEVKGGQATNYYMVLNGKRIDAAANPPKAADSCLTSKSVKLPYQKQAAGACTGNRFRVVIDRSGKQPVALFFGLHGDDWAYCSGTTLEKGA
ncbi:hypothetical protein [Azospirillum isscasi]|uniref:Uncharacterized protein n=1 Tax=Azospirillum isscasi TaxID=3053926 RepID=A0ABU0WN61_9PROT|nr:hypothetical protein [Azospirillum isscasi]MDQ2105678.1 hypothetical protein [Azospirillum isscasi]